MRLLVVEDNQDLNETLVSILSQQGYSVDSCLTGDDALHALTLVEYDGVILDIMLPGVSGFDVLQTVRRDGSKIPVLILTARDDVADRVRGLDLGADDYLVKPFSMDELLAWVRALVRRGTGNAENVYTLADLTVNATARTVTRAGNEIPLSSKEFSILECLIQHANRVLSREQILEHVWNFDYFGGSNIVDVYINYLRKKIDVGYSPPLIHTVRGVGYVLREGEDV